MTSMGITIFALMTIAIAALFIYFAQYSRFGPTMRKIGGASPAMAAIFLIFGLNLAFVSNEVWGLYDKAKAVVATEGDALRSLARVAQSIRTPIGKEFMIALQRYETYAVGEGWNALRTGSAYGEGGSSGPLVALANSDEMAKAASPNAVGQLIAGVNTVRTARNERFALASSGMNPVKWIFLCFLDIVALLAVSLASMEKKSPHIVASVLFLLSTVPPIIMLANQSNPYAGFTAVSPKPIETALEHLTEQLEKSRSK